MNLIFRIAFLVIAPAVMNAELVWESKQLEFHPCATDKVVEAQFQFTNTGPGRVTIDAARASCSCTTIGLEKKEFLPGEKGRIRAVFDIGRRQGLQGSTIRVAVRGEAEPVVLTMITHVPELMKIEPLSVSWEVGATAQPRTIKLIIPPSAQLRVTAVSSNDPRILTSLKALKEGSEYTLEVTPTGTERMAMATLTIQTESSANQPKNFQAFAMIKRSGSWPPR